MMAYKAEKFEQVIYLPSLLDNLVIATVDWYLIKNNN